MEKQWKKLLFPLISQIRYSVDSLNLINMTVSLSRKSRFPYYDLIVTRLVFFLFCFMPFLCVCSWLHACLRACMRVRLQRFSFKSKELQG